MLTLVGDGVAPNLDLSFTLTKWHTARRGCFAVRVCASLLRNSGHNDGIPGCHQSCTPQNTSWIEAQKRRIWNEADCSEGKKLTLPPQGSRKRRPYWGPLHGLDRVQDGSQLSHRREWKLMTRSTNLTEFQILGRATGAPMKQSRRKPNKQEKKRELIPLSSPDSVSVRPAAPVSPPSPLRLQD